jgi:hypothetical protein
MEPFGEEMLCTAKALRWFSRPEEGEVKVSTRLVPGDDNKGEDSNKGEQEELRHPEPLAGCLLHEPTRPSAQVLVAAAGG